MGPYALRFRTWPQEVSGHTAATVFERHLDRLHHPTLACQTAIDDIERQAIHLAARFGNLDAVQFCVAELQQGIETPGAYGRTPLLNAAGGGKVDTMRWLVGQGANVDAKGEDGFNAIRLANHFGTPEAVEYCRTELGQTL